MRQLRALGCLYRITLKETLLYLAGPLPREGLLAEVRGNAARSYSRSCAKLSVFYFFSSDTITTLIAEQPR